MDRDGRHISEVIELDGVTPVTTKQAFATLELPPMEIHDSVTIEGFWDFNPPNDETFVKVGGVWQYTDTNGVHVVEGEGHENRLLDEILRLRETTG